METKQTPLTDTPECIFQTEEGEWMFRSEDWEYFGPYDSEEKAKEFSEYIKKL